MTAQWKESAVNLELRLLMVYICELPSIKIWGRFVRRSFILCGNFTFYLVILLKIGDLELVVKFLFESIIIVLNT